MLKIIGSNVVTTAKKLKVNSVTLILLLYPYFAMCNVWI